jgi:hypothetical protein
VEKGPYELGLRVRISTKTHCNPSFNNPRIVQADKTTGQQIFFCFGGVSQTPCFSYSHNFFGRIKLDKYRLNCGKKLML